MIQLNPRSRGEWDAAPAGTMVAPGTYSVTLGKEVDGVYTELSEPMSFEVVPLRSGSLKGADIKEVRKFWDVYEETSQGVAAASKKLSDASLKTKAIGKALHQSQIDPKGIAADYEMLKSKVAAINKQMYGSPARNDIGEKTKPTVGNRLFSVNIGITGSTYGPTETHKESITIIRDEVRDMFTQLNEVHELIESLAQKIYTSGGPMIEGVNLK